MSTATAKTVTIINNGGSGLLYSYSATSPVIPAITVTTPVNITSYTIPANTFSVGDVIRITFNTFSSCGSPNINTTRTTLNGVTLSEYQMTTSVSGAQGYVSTTITGRIISTTQMMWGSNTDLFNTGGGGTLFTINVASSSTPTTFNTTSTNTINFEIENISGNGGAGTQPITISIEKV